MKLSLLTALALVASAEEEAQQPTAVLSIDANTCAKFIEPVRTDYQAQLTAKQNECIASAAQTAAKAAAALNESQERANQTAASLKTVQDEAASLKTRLQEFEAHNQKLLVELKGLESTKTKLKELEGMRGELETLKKANAELSVLTKANSELKAELANVKTSYASVTEEVKVLRSKGNALEVCEKSRSSSEQELANAKAAHVRALSEKHEKLAAVEVEAAKLKQELSASTEKIYTAARFWQTVEHSKHIGSAFLLFARNRLVKIVGPDTYELAKLQMQLWYSAGAKHASAVVRPIQLRSTQLYDTYMKRHVTSALAKAAVYAEGPIQAMQKKLNSALVGIEGYMERVVTNLSDGTPSVREVFPENFHDRCFAFAFISLVLFCSSTLLQWTFATFVTYPVSWSTLR